MTTTTYPLPCLQREDDDVQYRKTIAFPFMNPTTAILPNGFDSLYSVSIIRDDGCVEPLSPFLFQSLYFESPFLHPAFLDPFQA